MMCNRGTTITREWLGFADAVKRSFVWLEGKGFRISEEADTLVRYQRNSVEVTVYHGRSSFEIGVEVGTQGSEVRFSLSELMGLIDRGLAKAYRLPSATTPETVSRFVEEQALRLQRYGEPILGGDDSVWERLASSRRAWSEEYAFAQARSRAFLAAREALRARAFPEIVRLLQPFEGTLPHFQRHMLEVARRRSGIKSSPA